MDQHLRVLDPGFLTTVQDLGRPGLAASGVPTGGAADALSLRVANRTLGNRDTAAALEMTLIGPTLEFHADTTISLAGAACEALILDGAGTPREVAPGTPERILRGETIRVGPLRKGARAYLAVLGGIDVSEVLGSRSTFLPATFGGFEGRALKKEDRVPISSTPRCSLPPAPTHIRALIRDHAERRVVRALDTASDLYVRTRAVDAFWSSSFTISPHSDRVGLRLAGAPLPSAGSGRMPSQGMMHGAVQLPPGGEPIVLMSDHPTTGGYPVIACVATVDLPILGQLRPGDLLRFERITQPEALEALRERERLFFAWSATP
jgi:antagonist of KipI